MSNDNPYNFLVLQPTGRNETDTANTYAPKDMVKIYEQQFLIQVPEEKLTEFLPALKRFYDIDNNTLDVSAIIFDAIAEASIIYNHKIKVGDGHILGELMAEAIEYDEDNTQDELTVYTVACQRTFFINDIKIPYNFHLFIYTDGYSTLTNKQSVLEKMYWFIRGTVEEHLLDEAEEQESVTSINQQLACLGIGEMDLSTMEGVVNHIEQALIDDAMVEALNQLLEDAE